MSAKTAFAKSAATAGGSGGVLRSVPLAGLILLAATSPAFAQTAGAPGGSLQDMALQFLPLVGLFVLAYFLMIRPQQQRMKQHQQMVAGVKRNDTVVLNSGVIGKVVRVEDKEVGVEIAQGVTVKVVKTMISDVRSRGEPAAANDSKV